MTPCCWIPRIPYEVEVVGEYGVASSLCFTLPLHLESSGEALCSRPHPDVPSSRRQLEVRCSLSPGSLSLHPFPKHFLKASTCQVGCSTRPDQVLVPRTADGHVESPHWFGYTNPYTHCPHPSLVPPALPHAACNVLVPLHHPHRFTRSLPIETCLRAGGTGSFPVSSSLHTPRQLLHALRLVHKFLE